LDSHGKKKLFSVLADFSGLFVSLLVSYYAYRLIKQSAAVKYDFQSYLVFSLSASLIIVFMFWLKGIYYSRYFIYNVIQVYKIINYYSFLFLLIFIAVFFSKMIIVPRLLLLITWTAGLFILILPRLILPDVYKLQGRLRILLLHDRENPFDEYATENDEFKIISFKSDENRLKNIKKTLRKEGIDILIVDNNHFQRDFLVSLLLFCERNGIEFVCSAEKPFPDSTLYRLDLWEGFAFLYSSSFSCSIIYRLGKRAVDLFISVVLLPVFVLSFVWLCIRKGGSPIEKISVPGKRGKNFDMYLFKDIPASRLFDYTGFRKLPSVINIFKNQLTYVGVTIKSCRVIKESFNSSSLCLKPGLIGMGTVFGDRLNPLFSNISLDFNYALNPSLIMDICIIFFCWTESVRALLTKAPITGISEIKQN